MEQADVAAVRRLRVQGRLAMGDSAEFGCGHAVGGGGEAQRVVDARRGMPCASEADDVLAVVAAFGRQLASQRGDPRFGASHL